MYPQDERATICEAVRAPSFRARKPPGGLVAASAAAWSSALQLLPVPTRSHAAPAAAHHPLNLLQHTHIHCVVDVELLSLHFLPHSLRCLALRVSHA